MITLNPKSAKCRKFQPLTKIAICDGMDIYWHLVSTTQTRNIWREFQAHSEFLLYIIYL
jgi:hypothetical protein